MKDKSNKFGIGLVIGAIAGGLAALFMSPNSGVENRRIAKEKLSEIRNRYRGMSADEIARDIFGVASAETKRMVEQAKMRVDEQTAEFRGKISEGKYNEIVDDVVTALKNEYEATASRWNTLSTYLSSRFSDAKGTAKEDMEEVKTTAKKKVS